MYTEKYKTLLKDSKQDLHKWKDISCSWIRRVNNVKMEILPILIYTFNKINIKISTFCCCCFCRNVEANHEIHMELQRIQKSQKIILKKKNKIGLTLPNFKTY